MQLFYFGWSDSFFSWSRALRFFRNWGLLPNINWEDWASSVSEGFQFVALKKTFEFNKICKSEILKHSCC